MIRRIISSSYHRALSHTRFTSGQGSVQGCYANVFESKTGKTWKINILLATKSDLITFEYNLQSSEPLNFLDKPPWRRRRLRWQ